MFGCQFEPSENPSSFLSFLFSELVLFVDRFPQSLEECCSYCSQQGMVICYGPNTALLLLSFTNVHLTCLCVRGTNRRKVVFVQKIKVRT